MNYFLFFLATILAGAINALAGGGGLITFPLLMLVVTPVTADATSALALFFAYPTAVWRTRSQLEGVFVRGWLWLLLIPSAGRFDWRRTAKPDGQSQLHSVSTVVGLGRHCHYCATADPGSSRRNWQRASRHPRRVVARRNCGHFFSGIVWRLLRLRDWYPYDRRAEFYLAGRYPACGRA